MRLKAYAVDGDVVGFEGGDKSSGGAGFGRGGFDIVVVVVEFWFRGGAGRDVGESGRGELEGEGDVGRADGVVEDTLAVGAVFIQGFVDDVPGVTG